MPKTNNKEIKRYNPLYKEDKEEEINDDIPNIFQDIIDCIIDVIKAGLKYNKEEGSKFIEDFKIQLFNIRKRKTNNEKNKYICYYASRIFPKEDGEEKYNKKISLYKEWYQSNQPEIFIALEKLYKLYFKYSKYNIEIINDDETVNSKFEKIMSNINNELINLNE